MTAREVFNQQNGDVTRAYYQALDARGPFGQIATALFRAQKRSARAKDYNRGKYRSAAYDVKSWSIGQICGLLAEHGAALGFGWGWKQDHDVRFGDEASWVLYVTLPGSHGQVSFHSPSRGAGPDYSGDWDGQHASTERIIAFCDSAFTSTTVNVPEPIAPAREPIARLTFGDPASISMARAKGRQR